jgi:alcohol dehydrogenase class IV
MTRSGTYVFLAQDRVIFGKPASEAVIEEAARRNARRVFVVASKTLSRKTDVIAKIRAALGERFAGLFDDTREHVPRDSVLAAAAAVRAADPDLIVTVGGGTPIDTVKVMLVCLAENITSAEALGDYYIRAKPDGTREVKPVRPPPVRQIIVPTTLSGAEFSNLGAAIDPVRQVKDLYTGREIGGDTVILDPAVTAHTPAWLWLSTGMRAVDHAVETICSKAPQPFTDATCLYGLEMLSRSLRRNRAAPEDLAARLDSQLGVWLSTTGLGRVPWGASHGIGHQLGAVAGVPHGYCTCVMLPAVLRWNKSVNAAQQALVARALGADGDEAAGAVAKLIADLGMPSRLRDVGVKREHFDAIAAGSLTNLFVTQNPRPVKRREDVLEILEAAY